MLKKCREVSQRKIYIQANGKENYVVKLSFA